uniref:RNA-directed RNA polymerase n=3 Tax=Saguaro cactus virus TaxID=52274 RepID=A0A2R4KNJ9_9TOMB|nr:replication-related protein [Saguaro cactus virus]
MIEVRRNTPVRPRRLYVQQEIGTGLEYRVHNASFANLRRGLLERVFYVENKIDKTLTSCPVPERNIFRNLQYLKNRLVRMVGVHTRISMAEVVDCYQGRKHTLYNNAMLSLSEIPIDRKDAHLRTFTKAEKFCVSLKPDPAPRVIQPRSPRYNLKVAQYLKKTEHHIYRGLDKIWCGPTVMKGYNVEEVAAHIKSAWDEFQIPVAIGFDMSRFDQHVSVPALQFEHSIYTSIFSGDSELQQLLAWQLTNFGTGFAHDGLIRYRVEGCRMSGDMNTALGNCILACLITKYLTKGVKARLINNGDDCVLICEKRDAGRVAGLATGWLRFGFTCITEEPVYCIERIRFCQMAPIYDGRCWVMVRDPRVSLSKDTYSMVRWENEKNARQWFKAVGRVWAEYCRKECRLCRSSTRCTRGLGPVSKRRRSVRSAPVGCFTCLSIPKRAYHQVTDSARYSFYLAFGILPDVQEAVEHELMKICDIAGFGPAGNCNNPTLEWTFQ